MVKMNGVYEGQKHCTFTHEPSASQISTDAPKDNHGRGEAFSPTDLTAVSLGACMMTVMAIQAEKEGLDLKNSHFQVSKEMTSTPPRRIQKLTVHLYMVPGISEAWQKRLIEIAHNCPVKLSLNPNIDIEIEFHWDSHINSF